jgi:hypothetical protein
LVEATPSRGFPVGEGMFQSKGVLRIPPLPVTYRSFSQPLRLGLNKN